MDALPLSTATQLRLQTVRLSSISSSALLEKKHRRVYDLQPVKTLSMSQIERQVLDGRPRSRAQRGRQPPTAGFGDDAYLGWEGTDSWYADSQHSSANRHQNQHQQHDGSRPSSPERSSHSPRRAAGQQPEGFGASDFEGGSRLAPPLSSGAVSGGAGLGASLSAFPRDARDELNEIIASLPMDRVIWREKTGVGAVPPSDRHSTSLRVDSSPPRSSHSSRPASRAHPPKDADGQAADGELNLHGPKGSSAPSAVSKPSGVASVAILDGVDASLLPPQLSAYMSRLPQHRIEALNGSILGAAESISQTLRGAAERNKTRMDDTGVFHPNANAARAQGRLMVRLSRELDPTRIATKLLRQMMEADEDAKLAKGDEPGIEEIFSKFGKIFEGTVFKKILTSKSSQSRLMAPTAASAAVTTDKKKSRGTVIQHQQPKVVESRPPPKPTTADRYPFLPQEQEGSKAVLDFSTFNNHAPTKAPKGGPNITVGALDADASRKHSSFYSSVDKSAYNQLNKDASFKDFLHLKTMQERGVNTRANGVNNEGSEPLSYNPDGVYSGLLAGSVNHHELTGVIGRDVYDKMWFDSERAGKRPNYEERHSRIKGFKNDFVDGEERRDIGTGGGSRSASRSGGMEGELTGGGARGSLLDGGFSVRGSSPPRTSSSGGGPRSSNPQRGNASSSPLRPGSTGTGGGRGGSRSSDKANGAQADEQKVKIAQKLKAERHGRSNPDKVSAAVTEAKECQVRLSTAWERLEFPMIKRLQFLQKYADSEMSPKLMRAVTLWEKAGVVVPLREAAVKVFRTLSGTIPGTAPERLSPSDLWEALSRDTINQLGCDAPMPESFNFEVRVEAGNLSDKDLLEIANVFEDQRSGKVDDPYVKDLKNWVQGVIDRLSGFIARLGAELHDELGEQVMWRGLPYLVK